MPEKITWVGNHDDLATIQSLSDLLDQAREVIKNTPSSVLYITANFGNQTITFNIDTEEQSYESVIAHILPDVNTQRTMTFHCRKG